MIENIENLKLFKEMNILISLDKLDDFDSFLDKLNSQNINGLAIYNSTYSDIRKCISNADIVSLNKYLEYNINWAYNENEFIKYTSEYGLLEVFKFLLSQKETDVTSTNNFCFRHAAGFGYFDIMDVLLKIQDVDHNVSKSLPITEAYRNGYTKNYLELFKHKHIKNALKINNPEIYNKIQIEISQNTIKNF